MPQLSASDGRRSPSPRLRGGGAEGEGLGDWPLRLLARAPHPCNLLPQAGRRDTRRLPTLPAIWRSGGPDGEDRSRLQGRQRQSAEVVAAARRGLRLSRRRGRRAAVPRLARLHVLRAGPVRPPLQGDDPAPDHGDGRGRDHPRRRRPPRGGDPQSEGPRQAEADRHRHHCARRDARRGLWRRARRDQGAPGRGARRDRARARPDARFRRRDRGGLVEGGRGDDRIRSPSGKFASAATRDA